MIYILEDFSQISFGGGQRFTVAILIACSHISKSICINHLGSSLKFKERLLDSLEIVDNIKFSKTSNSSNLISRFIFLLSLISCLTSNPGSIYLSCTKFCTVTLILSSSLFGAFSADKFILFHHLHPPANLIISFIYSIAFNSSRFIHVYPSNYVLNQYHSKYRIPAIHYVSPTPCIRLPKAHSNGVPTPLFQAHASLESDIIFGYVGMIHPSKGLFQLIALLSTFRSKHPTYRFTLKIYGTGPDAFLSKLFSIMQTSQYSIQFYGSIQTNQQVFSEMNCLFVPSWNLNETLCFTALEGIAYSGFVLLAPTAVLKEYGDNPNVSFINSNPIDFCETLDQLWLNISTCKYLLDSKVIVDDSGLFESFWSGLLSF